MQGPPPPQTRSRPPGAQAILAHSVSDTEQEEGMVAHTSGAPPGKPHQEPKFRPTQIKPKGVRGRAGPADGPGVDSKASSLSTEGFGAGWG